MISIIVPIYNTETYLEACIESLLCQTEQNIEVILVDDESTDGSLGIAQRFAQQDKRVKLLQQSHAGQSAARNLGLRHAKGEYIAFVDADDRIEPDWCERHLAAIEGVDYVQSGYQRVTANERQKANLPMHPCQFTSPCMRLYRKQTINGHFFAEGYIYEDVLFSVDLWLSGAKCRMIDYAGYLYTLNPKSTTAEPHPEAQQRVLNALTEKAKNASLKGKIIVYYTYLRLKTHFIISDNCGSGK